MDITFIVKKCINFAAMAFPTTLIDAQDIAEVSAVNTELDAQYVRPSISNAESFQIIGIIGRPYYDYLINAKATNTLLAQDVLVIAELRKALVYWSLALIAKAKSYTLTNKGVIERMDATSKRATPGAIAEIIGDFTQNAEHYGAHFTKWFIDYVKANPALFPLVDLTQCPTCCALLRDGFFQLGIVAMPRSADMKGWNLPRISYNY